MNFFLRLRILSAVLTVSIGAVEKDEESEDQAEVTPVTSSGDGVADVSEGQTFGYVGTMSPVVWDDKL